MSARVLVLLAAIFLASTLTLTGTGQRAQAKEPAEEAAEEAEERAEEAEELAEERAERAEEEAEEEAERAKELAEERAERSKKRDEATEDKSRGPGEVTLEITGGPETEFSGTCSVGDEENVISGQVPQSFNYSLNGQKLECEIRKQGADDGSLKVVLTGGDSDRSVYRINGQGPTIELTYANGGISSSSISSGSGGLTSTSSQTSSSSSQVVSSTRIFSSSS